MQPDQAKNALAFLTRVRSENLAAEAHAMAGIVDALSAIQDGYVICVPLEQFKRTQQQIQTQTQQGDGDAGDSTSPDANND